MTNAKTFCIVMLKKSIRGVREFVVRHAVLYIAFQTEQHDAQQKSFVILGGKSICVEPTRTEIWRIVSV